MTDHLDLAAYYDTYKKCLLPPQLFEELDQLKNIILKTNKSGGQIFFAGNGASAAIASHLALDLTKQGGVRSTTFHDAGLITAFTNDFGGDNWLSKACDMYVESTDLVIFISVSGESPNVVNAARRLRERGIQVGSFTGKKVDNALRGQSDYSFWVDSSAYNIVECIHMIWLTTVVDMIIGKSEYSVS